MVLWANRASWILSTFYRFHGNRKCKNALLIILNVWFKKQWGERQFLFQGKKEERGNTHSDLTGFEFGISKDAGMASRDQGLSYFPFGMVLINAEVERNIHLPTDSPLKQSL